ncbi:MAG: AbrB/MazE/SpoVT family DNA-binding domain-containing protein [Gammaproteobacteria bacterium]|jgi:AbrB family looped-hinge helix DNA binding protein|nr:AbrB/MazE/SpoVT family DNA-binding domain-containing protein [Gammaproteobacteria bacterium]MBT3726076.1 AbrB/MazE/SpoVT family DNA-binding domain-containing protein [Gammaproteobacteria bacterium]MBT4077892.1 AbrB/MazE/SpoVT family DNA-binding domain-containing protein [Gammaproteobacteria bacterium]MBT4195119.1 AbrB/MazE/SpoVT family DNA-binding domain-containing protein [Gammaproteobacteria bacterium]MBT4449091.1 AbrB/MazE/SpoVT family DNA-binding domain-containing protein [Gammaproteobac
MNTVKLSSKGQVIIPKPLRTAYHWETGQELVVVDTGDGILLKPKTPFVETNINQVAAILKFKGKAKSLEEMELAILKGVNEQHK